MNDKFEMYYPVKPWVTTQKFGETSNNAYYQANNIFFKGHNGIDIRCSHGQPIFAAHDGEAYYETDQNQGHGVIIRTTKQFDYGGNPTYFKSIYWHFCDPVKEPKFKSPITVTDVSGKGQPVKAGDLIGYADTTGLSTGDHLHFGLKPQHQNEFNGQLANLEDGNGYYGAIDPAPYLNGKYAQDISAVWTHTFYIPMSYGDESSEVANLQKALQILGYFPQTIQPTGYYGEVTVGAVFAFQRDCVCNDWSPSNWPAIISVWTYMGRKVGKYSIPALNKLFSA